MKAIERILLPDKLDEPLQRLSSSTNDRNCEQPGIAYGIAEAILEGAEVF
jgi:hypothetical protein